VRTILIEKNQATAALRRVPIWCVDATDGITPEDGEAAGQPEISVSGAAKTTTGVGTLVAVDATDGDYYAELTQDATNQTLGTGIVVSYKSANTAWDKVLVLIVASAADVVDLICDEPLTGATHNVATSLGRRIRALTDNVVREETAQAGSVNTITLDAGASATDGQYDPAIVLITEGTGAGQSRLIIDYIGSTKVATVHQDWRTNPDATSKFTVYATTGFHFDNEGAASGGGANTITLNDTASAVDDTYKCQMVHLCSGTGKGQAGMISSYNGTTKVATMCDNWATQPVAGTGYYINGEGEANIVGVADAAVSSVDDFKATLAYAVKKNTAIAAFPFAMFDSDGDAKTGLTVTVQLSKDGAAFGAATNAASEISAGGYKIDLAAADLNATTVLFKATATGAKTTFLTIVTES